MARTLRWIALAMMTLGPAACGDGSGATITVEVGDASLEGAVSEQVARAGTDRIRLGTGGERHVRVELGLDCTSCYRIEPNGGTATVIAGDVLGAQYGLAAALEQLGARFYHPHQTLLPGELGAFSGQEVLEPRMSRRGLHLHTLHPIEGYFPTWESGEEAVEEFAEILDWTVVNRGNYIQWNILEDIQDDDARYQEWKEHTRQLTDIATARGVEVGAAVIVFGSASLQQSFVLIDGDEVDVEEIERRLRLLLDGTGITYLDISFGEFFGEDPDRFIEIVDQIVATTKEIDPDVKIGGTIHVGEDQRITYQDEELIYYFLIKFADERLVPWVHTVMYYNLFDDAGGAYHHDDFHEHRDFLVDRLRAGEEVVYFPETAYWVAFDNSVPTYMPIYLWSRHRDLAELDAISESEGIAKLDQHVIFSTGWEWGYWQNDYLTLRWTYEDAALDDSLNEMLSPLSRGDQLAELVHELARVQQQALIGERLAAYMAGRDVYIDAGRKLDIVSQPDRVLFPELMTMDDETRAGFEAGVLEPLEAFAGELEGLAERAEDLQGDRWGREIAQGTRVTALRARFMVSLLRATVAGAEGGDPSPWLEDADELFAEAEKVIARRERDMHDPSWERLVERTSNATIYQFGYLEKAHSLCYWNRERLEVEAALGLSSERIPDCAL